MLIHKVSGATHKLVGIVYRRRFLISSQLFKNAWQIQRERRSFRATSWGFPTTYSVTQERFMNTRNSSSGRTNNKYLM